MRTTVVGATIAGVCLALTACAGRGAEVAAGGDRPVVVATVAPIVDIVARVAGPAAEVRGLVPHGVDSHTFEPAPSDARKLAGARLFVANGLFLEEPSIGLARAVLPPDARIVTLGDKTISRDEWVFDASFPRSEGRPNPHLWTNPPYAKAYARLVRDGLIDVDPQGADGYRGRYRSYAAELDRLDAAIAAAWETVPADQRVLVTYHDSWPYFARRYGLKLVAAIQPADLSEPTAASVRAVIDEIRRSGVPAIFGSEVFTSDVLARIAEETGVAYVEDLRDDALPGRPGDPEHSYVGMMVANVRAMVTALGGDPHPLDAVDPAVQGAR